MTRQAAIPVPAVAPEPVIVPFPTCTSPERRILVALSRMEAEGRQLQASAATLSRSANELRALADSMDRSLARLDQIQDKLSAQRARSRAIAAEADRIEQMITGGQLAQAEVRYHALAATVKAGRS